MQRVTEILRLHCAQTSTRSDTPPPGEIYKACREKLRKEKAKRNRTGLMAHDGDVVQQVVVTASEKRCRGIIERRRESGFELFNQKGGVLKGEIKMFLRFPDGYFFPFHSSPPRPPHLSMKRLAFFRFISASHPHP